MSVLKLVALVLWRPPEGRGQIIVLGGQSLISYLLSSPTHVRDWSWSCAPQTSARSRAWPSWCLAPGRPWLCCSPVYIVYQTFDVAGPQLSQEQETTLLLPLEGISIGFGLVQAALMVARSFLHIISAWSSML